MSDETKRGRLGQLKEHTRRAFAEFQAKRQGVGAGVRFIPHTKASKEEYRKRVEQAAKRGKGGGW